MKKIILIAVMVTSIFIGNQSVAYAKDYTQYKNDPICSKEYRNYYVGANSIEIFKFNKENKKLNKYVKKHLEDRKINLTSKGKIGYGLYYIQSREEDEYFYIGALKDNKPEGKGMIYQKVYWDSLGKEGDVPEGTYWARYYEGNFKDGRFEGFGRRYYQPKDIVEGETFLGASAYEASPGMLYENIQTDTQSNIYLTANPLAYEGYFESGKQNGKGNEYKYSLLDLEQYNQTTIEEHAGQLKDFINEEQEQSNSGEYICPESDKRLLSALEVGNLTEDKRQLAINEIYARHGRKFDTQEYQDYFNSKSWYNGTVESQDFSEDCFNSIEKNNIDSLSSGITQNIEESMPAKKNKVMEINGENVPISREIDIYTGEYRKGKQTGEFRIYHLGKILYEGDLKKGVKTGKGTLYYSGTTQKQYEGELKKGKFNGTGTEYGEDGTKLYSGKWANGEYSD